MLLRWRTGDPARIDRLASFGFKLSGPRLALDGTTVEVVVDPALGADERLELVDPQAPGPAPSTWAPSAPPRLLAVGWATVDVERAAFDAGLPTAELPADRQLGARVARLGEGPIVLLEPNTEGRVAAALARHGEGPVALYVAADGLAIPAAPWPGAAGPFGPSTLLEPGRLWGPFLIAVESGPNRSTTIGR
jgi:hypothetical protein